MPLTMCWRVVRLVFRSSWMIGPRRMKRTFLNCLQGTKSSSNHRLRMRRGMRSNTQLSLCWRPVDWTSTHWMLSQLTSRCGHYTDIFFCFLAQQCFFFHFDKITFKQAINEVVRIQKFFKRSKYYLKCDKHNCFSDHICWKLKVFAHGSPIRGFDWNQGAEETELVA